MLNISTAVPYEIDTFVYRKADVAELWNYPVSYEQFKKYKVVGYELTVISESDGENGLNLTCAVGNGIITIVKIGATEIEAGSKLYVNADLLQPSTPELETKISSIIY
jgi:hypothetical protein